MNILCTILAGAIDWFRFCVSIGHGCLNGWRFERLPVQNDLPLAQAATLATSAFPPLQQITKSPSQQNDGNDPLRETWRAFIGIVPGDCVVMLTAAPGRLIDRSRVTVSGYWKNGETDFRGAEGDERCPANEPRLNSAFSFRSGGTV
jgi:hypothetical protein